jgi:hypothetical protein
MSILGTSVLLSRYFLHIIIIIIIIIITELECTVSLEKSLLSVFVCRYELYFFIGT